MSARVVLLEGGSEHDVFELVELTEGVARVRTAFLFDVGEELKLRVDRDGTVTDTVGRVRTHTGPADARITELELGA